MLTAYPSPYPPYYSYPFAPFSTVPHSQASPGVLNPPVPPNLIEPPDAKAVQLKFEPDVRVIEKEAGAVNPAIKLEGK